jgi:hypothetical protein
MRGIGRVVEICLCVVRAFDRDKLYNFRTSWMWPRKMVVPAELVNQNDLSSKCEVYRPLRFRVRTEMRRTVDAGAKSTLSSVNLLPPAIWISIVPIPTAYMHDPPTPEIGWGEMGQSVVKSDCSGEMWAFAPVSRKNGGSLMDWMGVREAE